MNIRTLTSLCASLAVISGMVTVNLWRELRAERELTAGLRMQLEQREQSERRVALTPVPAPAPPPAAPQAPKKAEPAPARTQQPTRAVSAIPSVVLNQQELMKDPEFRKARLMSLRASIAQSYPGLVEELGLRPEEAGQLFDLLARNQSDMTDQFMLTTTGDPEVDRANAQEMARKRQAQQRQQGDEIRALLGDARYAQWEAYQPTRTARMQAQSYATSLAQAGMPVDNVQLKELTAAVISEQKSLQQDMASLGRSVDPTAPQTRALVQEALQDRQRESNQRILDAASPYLNAEQLGLLRAQFEQQDAINRASARARARAEALQSQP